MILKIGPENTAAEDKLPPGQRDGSKIGINYADAYIKAIKHDLENGGKVACKRRGIKLTLTIGDKTGSGLMRRFVHGPDEKTMLREALREAAADAGAEFSVRDGEMVLTLADG